MCSNERRNHAGPVSDTTPTIWRIEKTKQITSTSLGYNLDKANENEMRLKGRDLR